MSEDCAGPHTRLSIDFESQGHNDQRAERMAFPSHATTPYCDPLHDDERHVLMIPTWQRLIRLGKEDRVVILAKGTIHGTPPLKQWHHK